MLIIFEGPNGSGKTTAINSLRQSYCTIATPRKIGHVPTDSSSDWFDKALLELPKKLVFMLDRHCTSDYAYCTMRGQSVAKEQIWAKLSELQPLYVQFEGLPKIPKTGYDNGRIQLTRSEYRELCKIYYDMFDELPIADKVLLPCQFPLDKLADMIGSYYESYIAKHGLEG